MNPERWKRIEELFDEASQLAPDEWEAFLDGACGDDRESRDEVLRLLRAPEPSSEFIEPPEEGAVDDDPPDLAGRELGDFLLEEEIGRGGMGVVYRARQRSLGRVVAVKVLPPHIGLSRRQVDRFRREVLAVAKLAHPGIVSIISVGLEGDTHFFAMEFVDGWDLSRELERLRALEPSKDDSQLPDTKAEDYIRSVAGLIESVADALAYAHEHGIVHRDVKPSNLLLARSGEVRLVDFGLARDESQGTITRTGELAGTPYYMSPEQLRSSLHQVDHRTDVYSLGVVLYELLTLKRPFDGKTSHEVVHSIMAREPARPRRWNPRIPRDLEVICGKAMAKNRRERYTSAAELRDDLHRFLNSEAIRARPPGWPEVAGRWLVRHRFAVTGAVLAVAFLGLGMWLRESQAQSTLIREGLAAIRAALDEHRRGAPITTRIPELREHLAALKDESVSLQAADEALLGQLSQALDSVKRGMIDEATADRRASRGLGRSEGEREFHRLRSIATFVSASMLFPDDADLVRMAREEFAYPTLSVRAVDESGTRISASVFLQEVEVRTSAVGPRSPLGEAPVEELPVAPGYYRVVVVFGAGGSRELILDVRPWSEDRTLLARRLAHEDAITEGMLCFPETDYAFPLSDKEFRTPLQGTTIDLPAFCIDATEVSNGEYRRFLEANPERDEPQLWELGYDPAYDDLPVTGITWSDAVAYAEWVGKRLPTIGEWQLAARGTEGRRFPYPTPPGQPEHRGNVHVPGPFSGKDKLSYWKHYLAHAAPVRSHEDARTPEGAYHMYGNVAEWTESMAVVKSETGTLVPRPTDRFTFFAAWDAVARQQDIVDPGYNGVGPNYRPYYQGFRCAKTLEP